MLRFRLPDIFLGAIFGVATLGIAIFAIGFVLGSSQYSGQPTQSQGPEKPSAPESKNEQQEPWWQRAMDPIAVFTLGLVLVGAFQVGLFYVQLKLIRESLDDAKIAANAAKVGANAAMLSTKAAIALQLPFIRINPHTLIPGAHHGDEYCAVQFLTFFNRAPTKAFPIETSYGWTFREKELPSEPRYLATETFPPDRIFEPDRSITQQYLDFKIPLKLGEWSLICGDKLNLWFYCTFVYEDFMQMRHDAGFCWRWQNRGSGMGWHADDTPAYNQKT